MNSAAKQAPPHVRTGGSPRPDSLWRRWRSPRRLLLVFAALSAVTLVAEVMAGYVQSDLLRMIALASGVGLSFWGGAGAMIAEERVHRRFRRESVVRRVLGCSGIAVAFVAAALVLGYAVRSLLLLLWLDSLVTYALVFVGWSFALATLGSLLVTAVDFALSTVRPTLRTKIVVLVLGLGAVAAGLNLFFSAVVEFLQTLLEWAPGTQLRLGVLPNDISGEELVTFFGAHPFGVAVVVHGLAFFFLLPATLSAISKFAGSVVEGLRSLGDGFARLATGDRNFSIEVSGPRDMAEINIQFNDMVGNLKLAEKMERAFGTYVSTSVLERIRAQHGEASIPAAMRNATVFFADVRGFTAMSEKLTPAQVLSLLNRYYTRVVKIVNEHQGFLDKFIGDAVVVVFNVPVDQHDHAARAVACAIEIQKEIATLNDEGAFPEIGVLEVGIGIATGPMIAGNVGSSEQMEYTVIGDTVNLAARFCGHAPAGEVWVNQACTEEHTVAVCEALEPLKVKGKQAPVTPYGRGRKASLRRRRRIPKTPRPQGRRRATTSQRFAFW